MICIPYRQFFIVLLNVLSKDGFIQSYGLVQNKINVYLKTNVVGQVGFFKFRPLSYPGLLVTYSFEQLLILQRKQPGVLIYLYTDKGIISNSLAIKMGIGGQGLFEII